MKRVEITTSDGETIVTTVSDDATARPYEDLVLQPGGQVDRVVVTEA
ncbi:hypothetical protein ABZ508_34215 [Streptomyces lavendulocolor]|uniref:Uncharacterized protein n=1 Tax=Streptomyces lavendulocolor TaxID=67316 RepID=A0ABV2WGD3_9ACTN